MSLWNQGDYGVALFTNFYFFLCAPCVASVNIQALQECTHLCCFPKKSTKSFPIIAAQSCGSTILKMCFMVVSTIVSLLEFFRLFNKGKCFFSKSHRNRIIANARFMTWSVILGLFSVIFCFFPTKLLFPFPVSSNISWCKVDETNWCSPSQYCQGLYSAKVKREIICKGNIMSNWALDRHSLWLSGD